MLTYVIYVYTYTILWGGWTHAYISLVVDDDLIDEFMEGLSKRYIISYV